MSKEKYSKVVIIGAGFSGLTMACQLQDKLKEYDYTVYERSRETGGTWSANKYPGCAVDIPAALYSLSFAPNPNFSKLCPSQSEVLKYFHSVSRRYRVPEHIVCGTEWVNTEWQDSTATWTVRLRDLASGECFNHHCKILISAVGALVNPSPCDLPGVENFKGEAVHTARWREGLDLRGKDVVVVGNGASAAQVIPAVIHETKSITQFIRTPQYYLANDNFDISARWQALFHWIPGLLLLFRFFIFIYLESAMVLFGSGEQGSRCREEAAERSRAYMTGSAPQEYWPLLIPEYEIGCKRRVFDKAKYIPCLRNSKLHLTNDTITRVSEFSVVTKPGKHYPADTIVLATGFSLTHWDVSVVGRNGRSRAQHWKDVGYIEAFQSVANAGFPNFFYVLGPNCGRAHTSTLFAIESYTNLILRAIRPIIQGKSSTVEVKASSEAAYNERLHESINKTVFMDSCGSYFNDTRTGRNWFTYPWSSTWMWFCTHVMGLGDWSYDAAGVDHGSNGNGPREEKKHTTL
ncbi:flavin-containing monooxygenase [Aspergillus stella-maris]|uniref:flavin-containing monooxygenase n=1 Tax=Aspergillus stella-maris TaxID=1810926 RepID=UPI003CCD282C